MRRERRQLRRLLIEAAVAAILYSAISVLLFARALFADWSARQLGLGHDPSFLMWALAWWPHAISHGLNPFLCRIVWAPEGFNLAWSGGIPLPSLVASPLTAAAGVVATYNLLVLAAPVLAAIGAYILCRRFARVAPALFGGLIFGFSPYMLGQLIGGHLNLMLTFPAPLMVWAALLALDERISRVSFAALIAGLFVIQFLCSIELAATVAMFGTVAFGLAWLLDNSRRTALRRLIAPLLWSAVAAVIVLSPYLYYLFRSGGPQSAINSPGGFSADLANLIIPTRTIALGQFGSLQGVAARFNGNLGERDAYLGLPLLLVMGAYLWRRRGAPLARLLAAMFGIILLFALGPRLRVAGWSGPGMPWKLALHLPLIKSALPARFINYAFLTAAIVAALWVDQKRPKVVVRALAGALIIVALLPNLDAASWTASLKIPAPFRQRELSHQIDPGETAIVLPFGIHGTSMLWQAASGFGFKMAGGYTGMTPRSYEQWPIVGALMTSTYIPQAPEQLLALMAAKSATVVMVDDADQGFWAPLLSAIDPAPRYYGGMWLYRPARARLVEYRGMAPLALESQNAELRFAALMDAAAASLRNGGDPAELTPKRAQDMGFLPPHWVTDPDVRTNNGLYLGGWNRGEIAIGVVGSYAALQPLIDHYRTQAQEIFYPFPKPLRETPSGDTFMRLLVMTFKRSQLRSQ